MGRGITGICVVMDEKQMSGQAEDDVRYLPKKKTKKTSLQGSIEEGGRQLLLVICIEPDSHVFSFVCWIHGTVQVWRKYAHQGSSFREHCALTAPQS